MAKEGGRRLSEHILQGFWSVVHNRNGLRILTGTAHPQLAHNVAKLLGDEEEIAVADFGGGEFVARISQSVRKRDVFIVQPSGPPDPARYHLEMCFMLDAARRASAGEMTAIIPYLGFSRQERQTDQQNPRAPRESISAKVVIDQVFASGAERLVAVDLHADAETGFTNMPFDNVHVSNVMIPYIRRHFGQQRTENLIMFSPDFGGGKRAERYRDMAGASGYAMAYKRRSPEGVKTSGILEQEGTIKGRHILFVDDVLGTGKSLEKAGKLALENGASSISVAAAHGLFLKDEGVEAIERLKEAGFEHIFVSDTVLQRPEIVADPSVHVVSVAPVLAEAIKRIHNGQSIHGMN